MQWTVKLEGGPRRVNHAAVAIGDKVYTFGGYCSGENVEAEQPIDIHMLNTETYRWCPVKPSTEEYEDSSESMEISDDEDETEDRFRHQYNAKTQIPYQRYGHTVAAYNGKAYLWGGRNDEYGASATLHEFDPVTRRWRVVSVSGRVPPARDGHTTVVVGEKMYLFGGFEEDQQRFSQETYVFDFKTNRWSEFRTFGLPPIWRDFHTAVALNGKMYIFGGRSDQMGQFHSTRDVYDERLKALDLTTGEWTEPPCTGDRPGGRRSHSAWTYNGRMFIIGGFLGTLNKHYNEMYSFDPTTNVWEKIRGIGEMPSARRRQCTVVVGNRLFLFGGTMPIHGPAGSGISGLSDLADLYVLDYSPSLKHISARVLLDRNLFKLLKYAMPSDLHKELENMTEPNVITTVSLQRHEVYSSG